MLKELKAVQEKIKSKRKSKQMCSEGYVPLYLYGRDGIKVRCVKNYEACFNAKVK